MSIATGIEWTDLTWNPVVGCTRVSAGCDNCYAIRQVHRMGANPNAKVKAANAELTRYKERGLDWSGQVRCVPDRLELPLKLKKPQRIFVNSLSDLFHEQVPVEFIDQVFAVMARAPQHQFQILTKRAERMKDYCSEGGDPETTLIANWPLHNVWFGVSVEDQKTADERIPLLLQTPASVRFLSCEPLLGPLDLSKWLHPFEISVDENGRDLGSASGGSDIDWVIVGGESGPDARPMHPDWVRSIRDQCQAAGVPFFFKQNGEWLTEAGIGFDGPPRIKIKPAWMRSDGVICEGILPHSSDTPSQHTWIKCAHVGKKSAGRLLDGREWNEMPEVRHATC